MMLLFLYILAAPMTAYNQKTPFTYLPRASTV